MGAHAVVPCNTSARLGSGSPASRDGTSPASVALPGSPTVRCACCATFPTIALPPSCTDRFCTVIGRSPLPRWRLRASIWAAKVRASRVIVRATPSCCARSSVKARRQAERMVAT
ncbi:hypothetical protein D6B98_08905 [Bradyrhizobium sp. LVM 105]|nr:hypothetical protein D6B98_08905 [Bradyrhizobium sp. LVM 105]